MFRYIYVDRYLSVSRGVGLCSQQQGDVRGEVGGAAERVGTEAEAEHAPLARLGHATPLYSCNSGGYEDSQSDKFMF